MNLGIQKKLTLYLSGFLLIVFVLIFWGFSSYLMRQTSENIQRQQFAMTELIARSIDDKLGTYLATVSQLSLDIQPDFFTDSKKAQAFLDRHRNLLSIFDNGLFLVAPGSEIIAESPYSSGSPAIKLPLLAPFLNDVQKNGMPDISAPYLSPKNSAPAIIIAAPVSDLNGSHLGFLMGSINLTKDYFVEELMGYKIGKKGYLYIFNSLRTMILHPDKTRIMKNDVPIGANKLFDRAIQGFEGSDETINSRGISQIVSFKRLRTVDWILASAYPQDEAYAPVKRMRIYLSAAAAVITCLTVLLIWLLTSRITASLSSYTSQVLFINQHPEANHKIMVDSNDEVALLATAFNDLLRKLELSSETLENMTRTDPLTGLFNRRHLELEAPKLVELSRRNKTSTAVVMLDIDHFKKINDSCGHEAGDAVLIHLAKVLQKSLRTYDLVVRYGGEEFLLILPMIALEEAESIAERLRKSILNSPISFNQETLSITASLGVYTADQIHDLYDAIAKADSALYHAKKSGRNRVCLWQVEDA